MSVNNSIIRVVCVWVSTSPLVLTAHSIYTNKKWGECSIIIIPTSVGADKVSIL